MNLYRFFFLSIVLGFSYGCADPISSIPFSSLDQGWNSPELVKIYFHHSETQRQWAWEMLSKITWKGNEKVLDYASRDGKISAELSRLIPQGSILAIETSKFMVHFAKINFPNFSYPNLQFFLSHSLSLDDVPGQNEYDIVTALTAFHLISDPITVLKNLKSHLKSDGKLLLTIPTGNNQVLRQAASELFPKFGLNTPWNEFSATVITGTNMRTEKGAIAVLQAAGFSVESITVVSTDNSFYDLEDLIKWHIGTASATWQIPSEISQEFFTQLVTRMVELKPDMIDSEGRVRFAMPRLHIIARPA